SAYAERVLSGVRVFQQYSGTRQGEQVREFRADDSGADGRADGATRCDRARAGCRGETVSEPSRRSGESAAQLGNRARQIRRAELVVALRSRRALSTRR